MEKREAFLIFAVMAILFSVFACSVLRTKSESPLDLSMKASSLQIEKGWENLTKGSGPEKIENDFGLGQGIFSPEKIFFWILLTLAGLCLFYRMTEMFQKRSDGINLLLLFLTLGSGVISGIMMARNPQIFLFVVLGLTVITGAILIFKFHFLWFLIIGLTYTLFVVVGMETQNQILPALVIFFLFFGAGIGLINNLFIFVRHYFRRSV